MCLIDDGVHLGLRIRAVRDWRVRKQGVPSDVALHDVRPVLDASADGRTAGVHAVRDQRQPLHAQLQVRRVPISHPACRTDIAARR